MSLLLCTFMAVQAASFTADTTASEAASAPAIDESLLAEPSFIEHERAAERGLIAAVQAVLDAELSPGDRRRLGKKVLSASRVTLAEGTFPASGTIVVTLNVPMRRPDPEAEPLFISGAFTLDAAGTLATIVVPPKMGPARHDLESTGDVDGDGMLDLVLTEIRADASTRKLVTWTGGSPSSSTLPAADVDGC